MYLGKKNVTRLKSNDNYVLVEVDSEKDETHKAGDKIIHLYNRKGHVDTYQNNRIYGTVVGVPAKLNTIPIRQKYLGSPRPQIFTGHDILKRMEKSIVGEVGRKITAEQQKYIREEYNCGGGEYEYIYEKEIKIKKGDRVYFHFMSINDYNWMGRSDGGKIYKIRYEQLYCFVRDGNIGMLNGHIFIDPYFDEAYEEIDAGKFKTRAKLTPSGLVASVKDAPEYRKGRYNGEKIIYRASTDEKFNKENEKLIEGQKKYILREWDIVAKFDPLEPIDPYVLLVPDKVGSRGLIQFNKELLLNTGVVEKGFLAGEKVFFNNKSKENIYFEGENKMLVHKEDLMATIN